MEMPQAEIPALSNGGGTTRDLRAGGEPARVLVVDDNPAMLDSIGAVVAGMGLEVITANSGREALRRLLLHDFALILLDVNMPTMDGFETAVLIHGRPRSALVPIIFVTAEALGEDTRFRGYNLGAVDFIYSPIVPDILRAKVQVFADLYYLNRQLQEQADALRRQAEEIARQNRQLAEVSKLKSEFLANMSHELRTPLNAIIGFAEVLRDGLAGKLSKKQADFVSEIADSGEHLLALINDILDLSKVEAGKMELETEPLDLVSLLQGSLVIIKEKALKHHITLELALSGAPEEIVADARKLKQIVFNLLSNAVKFTPDGGQVELSARTLSRDALQLAAPVGMALRQLPLPAGPWQRFVEIMVSDNGIGIAAADLPRLFQSFEQIDASMERNYQGTGLGLALVRRMTALHGGTVAVASAPGQGSRFAVWLPCRTEQTAEIPAKLGEPAAAPLTAGVRHALVIEDDPQAASILRLHLESAGFNVAWAQDAEQGLALAEQETPDLITLDLLLPGMGGWEALERLKANPALAAVPVVIISIVAEQNRGFVLGAAKVLQKPLRRIELMRALRALGLGGRQGRHYTVLAVDDDPSVIQLLAAQLAKERHCTLQGAGSGREALEKIHQALPDLLILDLMMPGISGFDVVEALKSDPATATLPILILTAKTLTSADRERLNGHVLKIMEKSRFEPEQFLNEVRRALGGS